MIAPDAYVTEIRGKHNLDETDDKYSQIRRQNF